MNDSQLKFTADLLKSFKDALGKFDVPSLVSKAADSGAVPFKVIISTSDEDRQGDSLDQSKWDLANFKSNPVVLWAHDYYSPPIAVCTSISVEGGKLVAEGKFTPEDCNPFGAQIARLYQAGFINTTSVGYMMHEDGSLELLEFSFVPVPANPYALSMRDVKKLSLDMPQLVMKGLRFEAKAEKPGDTCEMPDGTPGILANDPDNEGELVCVPSEPEKAKTGDPETDPAPQPAQPSEDEPERKGLVSDIVDQGAEYREKNKRMDYVLTIIYAFCNAYYESPNESFYELLEEAIGMLKDYASSERQESDAEEKAEGQSPTPYAGLVAKFLDEGKTKSGRAISAKNKEHLAKCIKALEEHHSQHDESTKSVIAALQELIGSEESGEGEEPQPEKGAAPNSRSRSTGAAPSKTDIRKPADPASEFDLVMLARKLLRTFNSESADLLQSFNKKFREAYPDFR